MDKNIEFILRIIGSKHCVDHASILEYMFVVSLVAAAIIY